MTNSPIRHGSQVIGILGVARDITDERERDLALERSEIRYTQLVESASDAIFTVDTSGLLTGVNRSLEEATGKSRDELIGLPVVVADRPARPVGRAGRPSRRARRRVSARPAPLYEWRRRGPSLLADRHAAHRSRRRDGNARHRPRRHRRASPHRAAGAAGKAGGGRRAGERRRARVEQPAGERDGVRATPARRSGRRVARPRGDRRDQPGSQARGEDRRQPPHVRAPAPAGAHDRRSESRRAGHARAASVRAAHGAGRDRRTTSTRICRSRGPIRSSSSRWC